MISSKEVSCALQDPEYQALKLSPSLRWAGRRERPVEEKEQRLVLHVSKQDAKWASPAAALSWLVGLSIWTIKLKPCTPVSGHGFMEWTLRVAVEFLGYYIGSHIITEFLREITAEGEVN